MIYYRLRQLEKVFFKFVLGYDIDKVRWMAQFSETCVQISAVTGIHCDTVEDFFMCLASEYPISLNAVASMVYCELAQGFDESQHDVWRVYDGKTAADLVAELMLLR